jgi:hypothetical protein
MSSVWTPCLRKVERTVRIGVGIKAASLLQILGEERLAFAPAFQRCECDPLAPFVWKVFEHLTAIYRFQRFWRLFSRRQTQERRTTDFFERPPCRLKAAFRSVSERRL